MSLIVNGEPRNENAVTLTEVWAAQAREQEIESPRGFAIALNGRVIPQSRWADTRVKDGDEIEIVRAMSGG